MENEHNSNLEELVSNKRYDYYVTHRTHELLADAWEKRKSFSTALLVCASVFSLVFASDLLLQKIPVQQTSEAWILVASTVVITIIGLADLIFHPQERAQDYHQSANDILEVRNKIDSLYAVLLDGEIEQKDARADLDAINTTFKAISERSPRTNTKFHEKAKLKLKLKRLKVNEPKE